MSRPQQKWELFTTAEAAKEAAEAALKLNEKDYDTVSIFYSPRRNRPWRVAPGWMRGWDGETQVGFGGEIKYPIKGFFRPHWREEDWDGKTAKACE